MCVCVCEDTFQTQGQLTEDGLGTKAVSPIRKRQIFGSVVKVRLGVKLGFWQIMFMVRLSLQEMYVSLYKFP